MISENVEKLAVFRKVIFANGKEEKTKFQVCVAPTPTLY